MQKGESGHVNKVVKVMLALLLSFTLLPQHLAMTAEAQETSIEGIKMTTEEFTYDAKSNHGSTPVSNAFNGNLEDYVDSDYNDPTGTGSLPQVFTVDFNQKTEVTGVRIYPRTSYDNGRPNAYVIKDSEGNTLKSGTIDPTSTDWTEISLPKTGGAVPYVDGIQIELTSADFESTHVVTVSEIEVYQIDKTQLKYWIDKAATLNEDDYTSESWSNFAGSILVAELMYEGTGWRQIEIDQAIERIESNFNNLQPKETEGTQVYLILDDGVEVNITDELMSGKKYVVDTVFHNNPKLRITGENITELNVNKFVGMTLYTMTRPNNSSDKSTFTTELFDPNGGQISGNGVYSIQIEARKAVSGRIEFTGYSPIEEPEVDKSVLQELYDEVSVYEPTTTDTTFLNKLTKELNDAKTVLDDPDATEDDVYYATTGLKAGYLLAQISGYNQTYRPMEIGGKVTDYSQYTTESALPYYRAFKKAQYISANMDAPSQIAELEEMLATYEEALKGELVEAGDNPRDVEVGILESLQTAANYTGYLEASSEIINGELVVHLVYHNNGLNPNTNEEVKKLSVYEMNNARINAHYTKYAGGSGSRTLSADIEKKPLDGETTLNAGFQMDITGLEPGAYDFQLRVSGDDVSSTLGTYYTIEIPEVVDKTALQALYDEVESYTSSDNLYDDFVEAKEAAKVVLDDVSATQEEVDKAYDTLNNRYWRSRSNAYVAKYKDDVFPYTEYEAASTLPVVQVYTEARNHTVVSYPAEEYKKLVERFVEAEQQLKKLPENPRGVMAGPDEDMINTTEHRGIFTFSEYTDENGKQMLHIEYENNGINTITGESLGKFTNYNLEHRLSLNIDRRNYDGSGYSSKSYTSYVKPLDGEKDLTNGFQLDIEVVDPGMYSVRMTCYREDTESYGFYYTLEDTTPPTAEVSYSNNGELTNQDVTVTIQADEAIQPVEGWTLSDDQTTLTKVFSENTDGSVTISDLAGNTAEINYTVTGIDQTAPTAEVTYTKDGNTVIVTIQADEAIQPVEGWTLSDDQTTLTKVFSENTDGSVTISDLAGNTAEISYTVSGIDTTAPTAEVTYTKDGNTVIVTIQADEAIQAVEGWTLSDDQTTLTKVFSENTDGSVTISDLAGNTATINYTVSGIESNQPGEGVDDPNQDDENTPPKEDDDNTASDQEDADTAAVDSTSMFAMMLMISAGVVVLLQKRRKEE